MEMLEYFHKVFKKSKAEFLFILRIPLFYSSDSERKVKNLYDFPPKGPVMLYRRYRNCTPMQTSIISMWIFVFFRETSCVKI